MALRELLLRLGVDVDPAGVKKADDALGKIKRAAIAAAAAFVAIKAVKGIGSIVEGVRAVGDELDKTSQQIGISVAALEELRFAADLSGVGAKEFSNSLGRLQKNAFEAGKGNKTLAEDFKRLGINVKDASGELKSGEVLFTEFAEGISRLENDTEKTALSMNLMGRTGKQLLPLFVDGAEGVKRMREEAQTLGFIMGEELIAATVKLTDDQLRAKKAWEGIKNVIAGKLIPVFIKFENLMIDAAKALRGPLNVAFMLVEASIKALTDIVDTLIGMWGTLEGVTEKLIAGLGLLGFVFSILGRKAVDAGIRTAAAWILATLPIILMTALVGFLLLAVQDFIVFMKGGDSVIGRLIGRVKQWIDDMGGIGGAIKKLFIDIFMSILGVSEQTAKEIIGAFQLIWADIASGFGFLSNKLSDALVWVDDFTSGFVSSFTDAIDTVNEAFEALFDTIADVIGAAAEATGFDALVDKGAEVDVAGDRKRSRDRTKRIDAEASNRVRIFRQLEREGFGTFVGATGEGRNRKTAGLAGARAGAQERLAQLQQNINAPLTVNVDASGQSSPDAIGSSVATHVKRTQSNRQVAQPFLTAK